jgi:hypothetical protein
VAALKYLAASDTYLAHPGHRRSMPFEGWPDIHDRCPVCAATGCATYRGYYRRLMVCHELEVAPGPVAIRTGYCRSTRRRFSLLPDFLVPYRRLSRFSFAALFEARTRPGARMLDAIDAVTEGLGEEFYLPLSTAYSCLKLHLSQPP